MSWLVLLATHQSTFLYACLLRFSPPFETEAWERAKNLYLDDLNSDERKLFDGATPENLFYSASATQIQHQSSSRSRAAMQKLKPVVECLQNYGKAIDVFSNIEPLILCPIWGSIRVLLHVRYPQTLLRSLGKH
jgi:hypothetical protein